MSAELPLARPEPAIGEVVVGAPVRGRLARELAHLVNWTRGHGQQLIPAHSPRLIVQNGTPQTLRYRVEPAGMAIARVWAFALSQPEAFSGGTTPCRLQITTPDGTNHDAHPVTSIGGSGGDVGAEMIVIEDLSAKSDLLQTLEVAIEIKAGTASATIESVACWELPRAILTLDTWDRGVDLETCRAGQPIYDGEGYSLGAISRGLYYTQPRRHLIEWSGPWCEIASGSWVDLTELVEPCIPRKILRADTTTRCRWTVYYKTDSGTAGEVRVTSGIDATVETATLADTSGSGTMLAEQTIDLRCEDPTTVDGLPGGAWETVQFAVRRTSGAGTIYVAARYVWEPDDVPGFLLAEDGSYLLLEDGSRIVLEST